ncbi:MoaD/ThiS family protein [Dehalobacter sp. DCM]|uniref:MoaD/ThiS family protein n=1 Tax=Dehalobacter sp. DCM TaxID=2907827 RepID=UPI003082129C|nr:MoaD/ThiS family protein [Dehalobacter sp. DCM]
MKIYLDSHFDDTLPPKEQGYEVPEGWSLGDLLHKLNSENLNAVVNGYFVPHDYVFQEGDDVTLFTVLSGG